MDENYVEYIIEHIDTIQDEKLKDAVMKLVGERNYLTGTIKIDPLTGVYNRRILQTIKRYSVLALCDIDDFKGVNDQYGHDAGDSVLKLFSKVLLKNCRKDDIVCRFGGDEFLIVFDNCPIETIEKRMKKIRDELALQVKDTNINVSFSAGLAEYRVGKSFDETLKEADYALYDSKNGGKGRATIYKESDSVKSTTVR